MANDGTVKIGVDVDEKEFKSGLSKLGKTVHGPFGGLDEETERVSSALKDAGENALSFGDILKANIVSDVVVDGIQKITHGLGDFARSSLESGMNFEAQMSRVQAISGATAEDARRLADKAKEMGESTVFSATESAEALEYMAMAGWKTDDMLDGLAGIMNLAAASGEDLASTSDIVTDALTAFGMKAEESGRFADILAAASTNANTNVGMMGETFKYVAPVAGALGYSAEDSAVAIGLMANSGIKASQAGTALRSMLSRLAKPTDEVQAAMDALDLSLQNSDGSMKSLMDVMDDMRSGFKNLMIPQEEFDKAFAELNASFESGEITEKNYEVALERLIGRAYGAEGAERARYAAMLAGQEAMSGMLAIVSASEEDYQKLTDAIYNSNGAAEAMSNTMTDNLSGDLKMIGSVAESIGNALYEKVRDPLREVAGNIKDEALPAIKDFIDSVDTEDITAGINGFLGAMETLIPVLTGATAAMLAYKAASSIAGLIDKLKIATNSQTLAQAALNAVMNANPFVLVATLIAGVVTALTTLYLTNETFRSKVNAAWTSVKGTISNSIHAIVDFFTKDIPNAAQEALDWFLSIPDSMKDIGEDVVRKLWEGITGMGEWLRGKVDGFISGIISAVTGGGSKSSSSDGGSSRPRSSPASAPASSNAPVSRMAAPANETDSNSEGAASLTAPTFSRAAAIRSLESAIPNAVGRVSVATSAMAPAAGNAYGGRYPSPASIAEAFLKGMDGMEVTMDGRTVGRLVTKQQNNIGRAFGTA